MKKMWAGSARTLNQPFIYHRHNFKVNEFKIIIIIINSYMRILNQIWYKEYLT